MGDEKAKTGGLRGFVRRFLYILKATGIAILFAAGVTLSLLFTGVRSQQPYDVKIGDIAPEDIRAPHSIVYVSEIETESARQAAAFGVADVFDAPDPRIGRAQVRNARQIWQLVREIRADPYANEEVKLEYLAEISGLNIPPDQARQLLTATDQQFDLLEIQTITLIEDAMSGTVREGRVSEVTRGLELKISSDFPEALIPIALSTANNLVVPNSLLNQTATDAARSEATNSVPDVRHSLQSGEVIVRAGEQVSDLDLEAMDELELTNREVGWETYASAALVGLLITVIGVLYLLALRPDWASNLSHVRLVAGLFLLFLLSAQFIVRAQTPFSYLFPAAALAMSIRVLGGVEVAAQLAMLLGLLIGYISGGSLELATYTAVTGILAATTLRQRGRLAAFFQAGLASSLGGIAVLVIFHLPAQASDPELPVLLGLALLNGPLSTGITLVILVAIGGLTSFVTSLQLVDLMRPDHPLQRKLQQEALGTYQHTLSVVNLVEAAAEAVHADAMLARVGTLYHDIGKVSNPGFFIENRVEGGDDPHRKLSPEMSAKVVLAHVKDGLELAKRYRLPAQIAAFIAEHHGTLPALYFLEKARKEAAQIGVDFDETQFHYEGPIPQGRETAILMLADGCESAVRANRPASTDDMEAVVNRIVQQRIDLQQLDASGLTLNDIQQIKKSFVRTLKGMYHPRIKYPGDEASPASDQRIVTKKVY